MSVFFILHEKFVKYFNSLHQQNHMVLLTLVRRLMEKYLKILKSAKSVALFAHVSPDPDTIGSVLALAEILPDMDITVVTNAHDTVVPLIGKNKINVIVTGGKLDRVSLSYGGATAWATVRKISVDKAFFSCNGVDLDRGASEVAEIHAEFKENALQYCNEKILLCDASKLGVRSSRFFADFDMIDRVITDSSSDESFVAKLKASGVPVE